MCTLVYMSIEIEQHRTCLVESLLTQLAIAGLPILEKKFFQILECIFLELTCSCFVMPSL